MSMEPITSKANPRVKSAAALLDRRERKKTGLFLLEGARLCADAAQNVLTGMQTPQEALDEAQAVVQE